MKNHAELHQLIFEEAPYGIFLVDAWNVIVDVNKGGCRILGYSQKDLVGVNAEVLIHPADLKDRPIHTREEILESIGGIRLFRRYRRKDGVYIDAEVHLKAVAGTDIHVAMFQDITERKRAEVKLREREKRYRTLFEKAGDAIFILDAEGKEAGKIVDLNQAAAEMHGYSVSELLGKHIRDLDAPEAAAAAPERIRQMLAGKWISAEIIHRKKDGAEFPVEISAGVVELEGHRYFFAFDRDISERKRAEQRLRESEARYRAIFDGASDGILLADAETMRFKYANLAICRFLGYTLDEILQLGVPDIHPPNDLSLVLFEFQALIRGEKQLTQNIPCLRKDKSVVHADIRTGTVKLSGRPFIIGFFTDISDRMSAEKEKAELQAQLNQAQKMESLGTLAGGIAHDFNNILGGILGYAQLAQLELLENTRMKTFLSGIEKAGNRARDLVQRILAFSRQAEVEKRPVDLSVVINEALDLLRASLPATIEIRTDIHPDPGIVMADQTQIHQVLMNLCTNAFHAMKDGGGVLEIRLTPQSLGIDSELPMQEDVRPGKYLTLSVIDTGKGMDSYTLERIFEPYFTTKDVGEGTGLGLAVVHGIVKSHGGAMQVESRIGKGTAFHMHLPYIGNEERAWVDERLSEKLPHGSGRILVVDDEADLADIMTRMLTLMGYDVHQYTDPQKALAGFAKEPGAFDAVVIDMTMPKVTGLQLAGEMVMIRPEIPIVLCTGFNRQVNPENASAVGIRKILKKPIAIQELAAALRGILGKSVSGPSAQDE